MKHIRTHDIKTESRGNMAERTKRKRGGVDTDSQGLVVGRGRATVITITTMWATLMRLGGWHTA